MSKTLKKEYIPTGRENEYMKCELYYSLGGMNYFNYKNEPRGYYVSVGPVEKDGHMESYMAFSGVKDIVVACDRQSKKREAEALALYEAKRDELLALPKFAKYTWGAA